MNRFQAPTIPALRCLTAGMCLLALAPIVARGAEPAGAGVQPLAAVAATLSRADRVQLAMQKAVTCLYAQQANGNWEVVQKREEVEGASRINAKQWTGLTALTTYALLCAGESQTDKRLLPAIDFLVANPSDGVYASACRCLLWSRIKLTPARHAAAQKDVDFLIRCMKTAGEGKGLFYYDLPTGPQDARYDHSTSQMAALGLSVMVPEGFEVPRELWQLTEAGWRRHQAPDGSWTYILHVGDKAASMTAGGVATLFITQSLLRDRTDCKGIAPDPAIENGVNWLGAHFDGALHVGYHLEGYALFAASRVGVASGLRYFGSTDWYAQGADSLLATQQADGSWVCDFPGGTALSLLFLAYGGSPVVLSKLQYTLPPEPGSAPVARWNQRPQDLLNFVDWMGHELEHRLNWQVVDLSSTREAMHDAPILYIAGSQPLNFSEEDCGKLRQFVEEGGMIVGNADCESSNFSESFLKLGNALFPAYAFRELAPTHPIYSNEQYHASKFRHPARVRGLSNGVRELMLLPSADLSRAFQHRNDSTQPDFYQLLDDIVLYAVDTSGLEKKGNNHIVQDSPAVPIDRTIKLARLQYDGNWDSEPGGWRRLAAVLHNNQKIGLQVETIKLGDGKLLQAADASPPVAVPTPAQMRQAATKRITPEEFQATGGDPAKMAALVEAKVKAMQAEQDAAEARRLAALTTFKLAHLTGTDQLKLTETQRQELKKFVEAGGTLIIDAAGGSTAFAASADQMLRDTFGTDASQIELPLPPECPLYQQPGRIVTEIQYRQFARGRISNTRMPQLRGIKIGGRLAVIYSREDLSAGLVGEPVDGIVGYTPATATELMSDIVLYAGGGSPAHSPAAAAH